MALKTKQEIGKQINNAIQLINQAKPSEALQIFNSLPPLETEDVSSLIQFGKLCLLLNKPFEAIQVYSRTVAMDPNNANYLGYLGAAYLANHQLNEARHFLSKANQLDANNTEVLSNLGVTNIALGNYALARDTFEKLLLKKPSTPSLHSNLAMCYMECNQKDMAVEHAHKAVKKEPLDPHNHYIAGKFLLETGDIDSGLRFLKKAIELDSSHGAAYQQIAVAQKFSEKDRPFISKMEHALTREIALPDRANIHYALGKIYDDLHEPNKAFPHFKKANTLRKPSTKPAPPWKHFKQLTKIFHNFPFDALENQGSESCMPIFIVGTPRSGTTLIEAILSSHSKVAGAGELTYISTIANEVAFPTYSYKKTPKDWDQFFLHAKPYIENYLSILQQGKTATHIIDKQPGNYYHLGLICLLFPKARIIHTVRNPLDACLSCYFQLFQEVSWSHDLEWIGEHYVFYRSVMDFWKKTIPPNRIIDISYESLTASPETYSRQLIDFLGLEWEPACLDFYKQKNAVKTASLWQVQQPIYTSSQGRWQPYIHHLGSLAKQISPYISSQDKALFEASGMALEKGLWKTLLAIAK